MRNKHSDASARTADCSRTQARAWDRGKRVRASSDLVLERSNMKTCFPLSTVACSLLCVVITGCSKPASGTNAAPPAREEVCLEMLACMEEAIEVLQSVHNIASADTGRTRINEIDSKHGFARLRREFRAMDEGEQIHFLEKHRERMKVVSDGLESEYQRLAKSPECLLVLKGTFPIEYVDESKIAVVRARIEIIDSDLLRYIRQFEKRPKSLNELVEGTPDYRANVQVEYLTDPWGRNLGYDPLGPRNMGQKPDVWSLGPPHRRDTTIGNWP